MNRINKLFNEKKQNILSLYFCAGHPTAGSTADIIRTLAARGIDMLEIGIPFSAPMADGPVIQDAATKALRNGMSLHRLFEELKDIRQDVEIPLILMGYLNPIFHYGFEAFCQSCADCGICSMGTREASLQRLIKMRRTNTAAMQYKEFLMIPSPPNTKV